MRFEKILVPTDFSENAQRALQTAYDLATQLGAKLDVLHVQDESTLRTSVKEGLVGEDSTDEQLQVEVARLIEMRFSEMLAGLAASDVVIERSFRRGDPDSVIVAYANEIKADLVVVGMRGVSLTNSIRSALLGSVAESVIRKTPCPVLVVRLARRR